MFLIFILANYKENSSLGLIFQNNGVIIVTNLLLNVTEIVIFSGKKLLIDTYYKTIGGF